MIFWPDDFFDGSKDISLENYSLRSKELKKYGKIITKIRTRLRDLAKQTAKEDMEKEIAPNTTYLEKMLRKMHKGYHKETSKQDQIFKPEVPIPLRKKGSRRPMLTTKEKLDIVHAAIVQQLPWKEIS